MTDTQPDAREQLTNRLADAALAAVQPALDARNAWLRRLQEQRDAFLTQRDNLRNAVIAECDVMDAEVYGQDNDVADCTREDTARIRAAVEQWRRDIVLTARTTTPQEQ